MRNNGDGLSLGIIGIICSTRIPSSNCSVPNMRNNGDGLSLGVICFTHIPSSNCFSSFFNCFSPASSRSFTLQGSEAGRSNIQLSEVFSWGITIKIGTKSVDGSCSPKG